MESQKTKKRSLYMLPAESRAVWKKLRGLAENGDMKAIKLYYDILAKKEQGSASAASASGVGMSGGKKEPDMMPLAAIRRAVFGDNAMQKDYLRVLEAEKNGTEEAGGDDAAADDTVITEEDREEDTETVRDAAISDHEDDGEWESEENGEADA